MKEYIKFKNFGPDKMKEYINFNGPSDPEKIYDFTKMSRMIKVFEKAKIGINLTKLEYETIKVAINHDMKKIKNFIDKSKKETDVRYSITSFKQIIEFIFNIYNDSNLFKNLPQNDLIDSLTKETKQSVEMLKNIFGILTSLISSNPNLEQLQEIDKLKLIKLLNECSTNIEEMCNLNLLKKENKQEIEKIKAENKQEIEKIKAENKQEIEKIKADLSRLESELKLKITATKTEEVITEAPKTEEEEEKK